MSDPPRSRAPHAAIRERLKHFFSGNLPPGNCFPEILEYWAGRQGETPAFHWSDGESDTGLLTFVALWKEVRGLAGFLQNEGVAGKPVVLLYPPGLDFVIGFFACLTAGAIAVPSQPPQRGRSGARSNSIAKDCGARFILSTQSALETMRSDTEPGEAIGIAGDDPSNRSIDNWKPPGSRADDLAVIQYTSGSTGHPRGIMLSHACLIANCEFIIHAFGHSRERVGASWLPTYHDMGLIGGILLPVFCGRPTFLMSPLAFIQKPLRWLELISRQRVVLTGGPNFAYQRCVDKIAPEDLSGIDLSSWKIAFSGAEPVRPETIRAFTRKFSPYGFRRESFYPSYGMAEATLMVTGGPDGGPVIRSFSGIEMPGGAIEEAAPGDSTSRELVGCGAVLPGEEILIVDPDTDGNLEEGRLGEIWIQSPCAGRGVWNDPEASRTTFGAETREGQGPFLRSGDLGFFHEGQLFVTGRLKDLIIIRGMNYYPQDIEHLCERASGAILSGAAAALSVDLQGREQLVIIAEARPSRDVDWNAEIASIRREVTEDQDLPPDAVYLVRPGSVPKTTSGKIKRFACRELLQKGQLEVVAKWVRWESKEPEPNDTAPESPADSKVFSIVCREIETVARERSGQLTRETDLAMDLGLDSLERLEIAHALETVFGGRFPDEVLQSISTIGEICDAIETHPGFGSVPGKEQPSDQIPAAREPRDSDSSIGLFPEVLRLKQVSQVLAGTELPNPYFSVHEGLTRDVTRIGGRDLISFASYNYLGLSGHPEVSQAAAEAIERFGTSASASRLVSGNKTVHVALEKELARFVGAEDAIVFVSGYGTNETTIGHLLGPEDLILHDSLAHNSIIQGAILSGARRRAFEHNDHERLEEILREVRPHYRRVLIVIEGVYSMDGDYPDVPRFLEIKRRHRCLLMVDEAHSMGTLGKTGRGICEHFAIDPGSVDILMGTLSKSLGSCGGYIAGSRELVEYLRYTAPGFVYSVGLPPPSAAAALKALEMLQREPERVVRLKERSRQFLRGVHELGLDSGFSEGTPIIPVITGSSLAALKLSNALFETGFNVQPILYPAVPESSARLRFFITSEHSEHQVAEALGELGRNRTALETEPEHNGES